MHHAGDVEVETFGTLARDGLDLDVVDAAVKGLVVGGDEAEEVDDVVFVFGRDDNPRLFFGSLAAGHDGGDETVQTVLADSSAGVFLLLLEDVDVKIHLVQVEHVVVQRQFGILLDAVTLGTGVGLLVVELFHHVAIDALAEGVVILLEGVAVVEVTPGLDRQRGVVAVVGLHQLGVIIDVLGVLNHGLDMVKVHLLDRELARLGALRTFLLCLCPYRCHRHESHDEDEQISVVLFHRFLLLAISLLPIAVSVNFKFLTSNS